MNVLALSPVFCVATHHMARNHRRKGLQVPSSIVPARIDVSRSHRPHRNPGRPVLQARSWPHWAQRYPAGQRNAMRYSRQASSVLKRS